MVNGLPISVFILDSIFFGLELFVQFSEVFTVASYFKIVVKFSLLKTKQRKQTKMLFFWKPLITLGLLCPL